MLSIRPMSRVFAAAPAFQPKILECQYSAAHFPKRDHRAEQREARRTGTIPKPKEHTPPTPTNLLPLDGLSFPFNVIRSKSNNLPVYHQITHNGTLKRTTIRNVLGDRVALRDLIQQRLGLPEGDVIINNRTQHIMVRGLLRKEVLALLEEIGA